MVGNEVGSVLSLDRIIVLLLAALAVAWSVTHHLGWLPKGRVLSGSLPLGNRISRRAEALVLFCVATAVFVFTATNTSTGGRLFTLDQFRPEFARTNIVVAAIAAIGVLFGVLATLLWRTSTGVIVTAGILCAYGFVLNGPEVILESLTPGQSALPDASLAFVLSTPDVEGAELYVNDVHLGTLPYETTFEEFHRRVPVWAEKPGDLALRNQDSLLTVPSEVDYFFDGGRTGRTYSHWAHIRVSKRATGSADRTYYARVKLGDEWGYADQGIRDNRLNSSGRHKRPVSSVQLDFFFPERGIRIGRMLDVARLNDYAPGPEWFESMETYRSDGWLAVRRAMDKEPRVQEVLDGWTAWKYNLAKATDAESAWRVFEAIRVEADRRGYYMTSAIAGRAVELLTPRLDPNQLVRLARNIICSTRLSSWRSWQMNGRTQFGMSFDPIELRTGMDWLGGYFAGGRGEELSPGDYAVAHAIWMLDEILDAKDDTQPNIVERELVPAFIAYHYENTNLLQIASHIGGPAIEEYLLRQDWRADPEDLPERLRLRAGNREVNRWLYLLANLTSPAGRQFRRENQVRLMNMADAFTEQMPISIMEWYSLDFLFLDLDLGPDSLAMKYWARFKEAAAPKRNDLLFHQCEYLLRMEPLSTVDMYVACWQQSRATRRVWLDEIFCRYAAQIVPFGKRELLYEALSRQIQQEIGKVDASASTQEWNRRKRLLDDLKERLLPITSPERAGDLLAELRAGSPKYTPGNVAAWLANGEPAHPLVGMLADADEPSLRLLVMGALREHPTPPNRAILQKLLRDDEGQVREAAQAVAAELTTLKETPMAQLADKETGPATQ